MYISLLEQPPRIEVVQSYSTVLARLRGAVCLRTVCAGSAGMAALWEWGGRADVALAQQAFVSSLWDPINTLLKS